LAGTFAHPIAATMATTRADENLAEAIHPWGKSPRILIGDFAIGESC